MQIQAPVRALRATAATTPTHTSHSPGSDVTLHSTSAETVRVRTLGTAREYTRTGARAILLSVADPIHPARRWLDRALAGEQPRLPAPTPARLVEHAGQVARAQREGLMAPSTPEPLDLHGWIASGACPWVTPEEWAQCTAEDRAVVLTALRDLVAREPDLTWHADLALLAGRLVTRET